MIRYLSIILFLSIACHGADPKPLLVVVEKDPWAMVIGSDSPYFALYDDGTLITRPAKPMREEPYLSRQIPEPGKKVESLLLFDPAKMESLYVLSSATDQITTVIWTPSKKITIYGPWRTPSQWGDDSDPQIAKIARREKTMWESLPAEIRKALVRVDEECAIAGTPWLPKRIEVMFWPYEYAPEESILWPKDWPSLSASDTRRRGTDSYSVYLPSNRFQELRKFLATRRPRGAVLIDGKKMADGFRFPFPGEELWMR